MKLPILPISLTGSFIAFKLMGYISWSWLWVFSPLVIDGLFGVFLWFLIGLYKEMKASRWRKKIIIGDYVKFRSDSKEWIVGQVTHIDENRDLKVEIITTNPRSSVTGAIRILSEYLYPLSQDDIEGI